MVSLESLFFPLKLTENSLLKAFFIYLYCVDWSIFGLNLNIVARTYVNNEKKKLISVIKDKKLHKFGKIV